MSESYIEFKLIEEKPKTNVYAVTNNKSGYILGIIKWFGSWRQYCFFPTEETVYSNGCMKDIIDFINKLMENRKK